MGTVAIQTQCCLSKRDDEWEDDDGDSAQEGTAVQLVEPVPCHGRPEMALLARLLAHKPRCPGAFQTQPPYQPEGRRPIQICVDVKLSV